VTSVSIKENGNVVVCMEKVDIITNPQEGCMMVNLRKMHDMVLDGIPWPMEVCMTVNGGRMHKVDEGILHGTMGVSIWGYGRMGSGMGRGY